MLIPPRYCLPKKAYVNLNRIVMSVIFFIPLTLIALFESQIAHSRSERVRAYFAGPPPEEEGDPKVENPASDDDGGEICTVSFDDLVKAFPKCVSTYACLHSPGEMPCDGGILRVGADMQYRRDGIRSNQPRDRRDARLPRRARKAPSGNVGAAFGREGRWWGRRGKGW